MFRIGETYAVCRSKGHGALRDSTCDSIALWLDVRVRLCGNSDLLLWSQVLWLRYKMHHMTCLQWH